MVKLLRHSNGDTIPRSSCDGTFSNSQGLQQVGDTAWKKSLTSGEPSLVTGSGTLG